MFKNPPADSGLGRVMTDGASIRSIALDISAGVVTIDFNKAFVTEMNAGTTMEGMILSSIANTLGSYFLVEKVQITLEGEPYESGHMLFRPGEYLPFNPEDAVEYQG
ncbi:MAG: GerMN domain-containing protein [Clostridiales bacterium]|nr:GerMN domain-containing protein [Clostridiales bacterium]